jgi:hypothetical protein
VVSLSFSPAQGTVQGPRLWVDWSGIEIKDGKIVPLAQPKEDGDGHLMRTSLAELYGLK